MNMKNATLVAVMLGISGCGGAYSPVAIRESGVKSEFESTKPPAQLARCIAKNTEEYRTTLGMSFRARWQEGSAPGALEIIVVPASWDGTALVGDIVSTANGSKATLWQHPHIYDLIGKVAIQGC